MRMIERQIRKAGLNINDYTVNSANEVEILIKDKDGDTDYTATEKAKKTFQKKVASWGGFRTGYGSWILQKNYEYNDLVARNID